MEPLNQEQNNNQSVEQNPQNLQFQQPEKTNKFGKHFIFLLTLLIISLAGAGLVFVINSVSEEIEKQEVEVSVSDPYAGWKTYRNEEYGFEFKYPADFSFIKERSTSPDVVSLQKKVVFESEKLETIDVFITEGEGSISGPYFKGSGNVAVEEVFVGNKIGQRILGTVDQGSAGHLIFIPLSNAELGMSFTVKHVDNFTGSIANDWLLVESILSTFKFIDTSGWKTYRYSHEASGINFEIKYPAQFLVDEKVRPDKIVKFYVTSTYGLPDIDSITIETVARLGISSAKSLEDVLPQSVVLDGSGRNPRFDEFKKAVIGEKEFYFIQSGRFEGVLSFDYFTVKDQLVYAFRLITHIGEQWANPNFDVQAESNHLVLKQVLETLKFVDKTTVDISD